MEREPDAHDDALRTTLDAIRDLKESGVSPTVARKLDDVERALGAEFGADRSEGAKRRQFGAFAGQFKLGPEFFEPLSEDDRRAWGED